MKKLIIIVLALIVLAVLAYIGWQKNASRQHNVSEQPLLQDLSTAKINDIQAIELKNKGELITLQKNDNQWVLVESDNFPVDVSKIRVLLLGLVDSKLLEKKTSDENRYDKLGLDSESRTEVSAYFDVDKQDTAFFLSLGKVNSTIGTYVLLGDDKRAWLVSGSLQLSVNPLLWLQTDLFAVEKKDLQRVDIDHAKKEKFSLVRDDNNNIIVDRLNKKQKINSYAVNRLTNTLADIEIVNVIKESDRSFSKGIPLRVATLQGLVIEGKIFVEKDNDKEEDMYYASFEATVDAGLIQLDKDNTSDTIELIEQQSKEKQSKLSQQFSQRIFQLPSRIGSVLTFKREDVVEKKDN